MEGVQMHQDGIGLNAWMTGHGAHRELRTVDLDRAGPVASGHRQSTQRAHRTMGVHSWSR